MFKLFLSLFQFILSADTFRIDSTDNLTNHIDNIKGHSIDITSMIHGHNKQNYSYKLKVNQFINDDIILNNDTLYSPSNGTYLINESIIVPESIDWRDKNVVTEVKDQGKCGSCWSFSATGSIESVNAIDTGILKNASEQQLMDCSIDYGNNGCKGGLMDNAFKYVIDNGLCSEEEYPYTAQQDTCHLCNSIIKINDYRDIVPNNEYILKRVVAQQPVSAAIQANLLSFRFYSNGIYSDPNCGTNLDHGILIIGYGHDKDYQMDYWIIKNSWGKGWGENGYIRIQRNIDNSSGLCGITLQPSIPLINPENIVHN